MLHAPEHGARAGRLVARAPDDDRVADRGATTYARSRAACSSRARRSSGCATGSADPRAPPRAEALAESVPDTGGVYFVPAFVGLGAPYWDMYARGTIVGLTRGTTGAHLARAALEAIAFQSARRAGGDGRDAGLAVRELRVDGGAAANDFLMPVPGRHSQASRC